MSHQWQPAAWTRVLEHAEVWVANIRNLVEQVVFDASRDPAPIVSS